MIKFGLNVVGVMITGAVVAGLFNLVNNSFFGSTITAVFTAARATTMKVARRDRESFILPQSVRENRIK